jgi:hypothetical protein
MQIITFTNTNNITEEYYPVPASFLLPEWYKNLTSYTGNEKKTNGDGVSTATAKKCMPIFDAIVSGYIIVSPADVFVSQKETEDGIKEPYFEWANYGLIKFHPIEQLPEHPKRNGNTVYPKWINPWGIKTPKGYSVLFTQPMHRESPFTIFPGVVDTDTYNAPVNFPFVLNDFNFEGLIPAGTPIAQITPIKRENWKMSIGKKEDLENQIKIQNKLRAKFFDSYKTQFRQTKQYK